MRSLGFPRRTIVRLSARTIPPLSEGTRLEFSGYRAYVVARSLFLELKSMLQRGNTRKNHFKIRRREPVRPIIRQFACL